MTPAFATQSYKHDSLPLSAQNVINLYGEIQPKGTKAQVALLEPPGIIEAATLGSGPVRGLHVLDGVLYATSGGSLYSIASNHTTTELGGVISGTNVVSMDDNGAEVGIVNGVNGYIYSAASGFQLITDAAYNPSDTIAYLDGFFLHNRAGTGEFFRSDSLAGTVYDSTAFATAESKSDDLLSVYNHKQLLYAGGKKTIEIWHNANAANFPFQRISGATIERGLAGSFAITDEDETPFILGDNRIAYRIGGRSLRKISTPAIDKTWQNYGTVEDVICFAYVWGGHTFICYTFPHIAATFVYDVATQLWHERRSHDRTGNDLGRWRVNCVATAYGRTYVGDAFSGKLGYLDSSTYTEFGDQIRGEAVSAPMFDPQGRNISMPWFEADIETGVGLTSGQGEDPQIMLSISDDGGRNFDAPETWRSMGKKGEYANNSHQVRWDRLGRFYNRHLKLVITDPVPRRIFGYRTPDMRVGV